jgi:hypothetical protein
MPTSYRDRAGQTDENPASRIRSLDGKVKKPKSAQKPATRNPAIAHIATRYFMVQPPNENKFTLSELLERNCDKG